MFGTKATDMRNCLSIYDRLAEVDGKCFDDWKVNLIVDKDSKAILTLMERDTNFRLVEN